MTPRRTLTGSSSSTIKSHNLRAILHILLRQGSVSRVRIARLTGLSTTTVTNLVAELLDHGLVVEDGLEQSNGPRSVGRPRTALRLVPEARNAVGVHIGVGSITVAVTDLFARPLCRVSLDHPLERPVDDILDDVAGLVEEATARCQIDPNHVVGAGIGASGLVDVQAGVNVLAPNLGWRDVPLRERLQARWDWPVFVDNNVRAMALAESMFGQGQDVRVLAFVYARVGVGAGFIVDGEVYRGGAGAGEIGHITLMADNGEPCRCGNTGCLETLVSEPTILRLADQIAAADPGGPLADRLRRGSGELIERVFATAREGDDTTRAMLDDRARYMGIGLANLMNTLSPELIILGGIFALGQDVLFPVTEQTLRQRAFADLGERVQLAPPTFGEDAGVIGAAALALDTFFYRQAEVTF
jgi:predicted NBD/HSP70 family sugar kinase